jgi:hypothetical protein
MFGPSGGDWPGGDRSQAYSLPYGGTRLFGGTHTQGLLCTHSSS